jgi:polysaccharide chain length determinant protein (PEP-CTERM system associated)
MLPGKTLTPPDILAMARRRIWLIVIPPLVTFFLALVYSARVPNLYESDMLIAIDPQRVPDEFVRSTVTLQTDRRMNALQVQVLSRTTLQQVIDEFNLYEEKRQRLTMEEVITEMREDITVVMENSRARNGQFQPTAFHLRFLYDDPEVAAKVTQRLGALFVTRNIEDRGAVAGATNRFLETQLQEARGKLETQEQLLEQFRQQHGHELPTQTQANVQSLSSAQLQAQSLVESVARDRDRKQLLERLHREAENEPPVAPPAVPVGGSDALISSSVQVQLATARASLAALEQRYTPDHPDVGRARRQVAELQQRAGDEARAAEARGSGSAPQVAVALDANEVARRERIRGMAAEIESLDRQIAFKESEERRVRGEIAEYQRRLEAVPRLESTWIRLTRDYDTQQLAYRELLTKSTAAQVAANLEDQDIGERFRIVDPALVPVLPLRSKRLQYNAIGLAVGLLFGLGVAALLEFRDKSFWTEADVLDVLAMPVLATVPYVATTAEKERSRKLQIAASVSAVLCLALAGYVTWNLELWNSLQ